MGGLVHGAQYSYFAAVSTVLLYFLPAEGDAALIVVPDSNVLMNRPANLVRFAQLLDSVGSQVVEGQDGLSFTAKILFPFTVTRELDCMKDPRSGTPQPPPGDPPLGGERGDLMSGNCLAELCVLSDCGVGIDDIQWGILGKSEMLREECCRGVCCS